MTQITKKQEMNPDEPTLPIERHTPDLVSRVREAPVVESDGEGDGDASGGDGDVAAQEAARKAVEKKAWDMGWRPDKGPLEPDEFVRRGEEILPIVNANNARLMRENADIRAQMDRLTKDAQEFREMAKRDAKREVEAQLEVERERHAKAIEDGDGKAATAAADRMAEIRAEAATKAATTDARTDTPPPQREDPDFTAWKAQNEWYGQDKRLTMRANGLAIVHRASGLQGRDLFEAVEEELRDMGLLETNGKARQRGDYTDNGGRPRTTTSTNGKGKTYADLPREAKETCDRFISKGWVKDRAQYVRDYFEKETSAARN